jgi:hypothetical protein
MADGSVLGLERDRRGRTIVPLIAVKGPMRLNVTMPITPRI